MKAETDMSAGAAEDGAGDPVHHAGPQGQTVLHSDQPAPDRLVPDIGLTPAFPTYRHRLPVRVAHWINALCLPILIMSGFQIFNAHTALYWGDRSDRDRPLLSIKATIGENGERTGTTTVLGHSFTIRLLLKRHYFVAKTPNAAGSNFGKPIFLYSLAAMAQTALCLWFD